MLSSEFSTEMGAMIRALELKIRMEPGLFTPPDDSNKWATKDHIDRAIISLIALRLSL